MKEQREISYNEIKDGDFFYMPVNIYDIRYILAKTDLKKTLNLLTNRNKLIYFYYEK